MRALLRTFRNRGLLPDALLLIRLAAIALVIGLLWLGSVMVGSGEEISEAARQGLRIADLRGQIALLDETLTMSAHMAAWSDDRLWAQRFQDVAPQLDAAITTATALATPASRRSLTATLSEAHRDLSLIYQRAIALIQAGDKAGAQALLNGPELQYIRDVFAIGLDALGHTLRQEAEIRAAAISRRAWMRAGCFGLMAMLLVMAVMAAQQRVRLRAAACIDPLTQLPNRRQFYAHLIGRLEGHGKGSSDRYMLVVVGIDHFKMINDSYGHATADDLLQRVTERLRQAALPSTFLARVGGDEFALLIEAPPPWIVEQAPAEDVIAALSEPYDLEDDRRVQLGFSAGAVWVTFKDGSVGDIMRQAGTALQQAKRDGGGTLRIFDHAMDAISRDRALLEVDLRHAIDRGEIVPFFQPLVDLQSNRIVGVEALARWRHAERGWISPAVFIPMAEELGLIDGLMERMLRQACRAALRWPSHVTVAFNISPLQLRHDALPGQIRAILAETGFPARRLELEVTESALVSDLDLAHRLLEELRDGGVRLALDDFGTGYSSLKHLRCLPFDKLKIDASFVGGMVDDAENGKIVAAVVGLGHSLGLSTVAEGVETPQVSALLRELGCDIGQGWLYGRPVPAAALDFQDAEAGQAA